MISAESNVGCFALMVNSNLWNKGLRIAEPFIPGTYCSM
jgi:hypothetical protein